MLKFSQNDKHLKLSVKLNPLCLLNQLIHKKKRFICLYSFVCAISIKSKEIYFDLHLLVAIAQNI